MTADLGDPGMWRRALNPVAGDGPGTGLLLVVLLAVLIWQLC